MFYKLIKMRGLNRRMVAVKRSEVLFLEENELDGNMVTNVHFPNGRWVTAALSLDETEALLNPEIIESEEEKNREKKQLESWKRMAKLRAESQKEIDEAIRGADLIGVKSVSYKKEQQPDGSGILTIIYEPRTDLENE